MVLGVNRNEMGTNPPIFSKRNPSHAAGCYRTGTANAAAFRTGTAKMPSFFIEDNSQHHLQNHQEAYKEERKSPSPSTPHVVQESHPSSSFHPTSLNETKPSIEQLLSALNLDKERLLILALLFLLYTDGADQTLLLALLYLFFE